MAKQIIVIEGPSGVGKDAIMAELIRRDPNRYKKIPSYCTRARRPNEIDGQSYIFTDEKTFKEKIKNGDIFEHITIYGTYRGMSKQIIDSIINSGKIGLKEPDIVGQRALKKAYPNQVLTIFLTADKEVVIKRLLERNASDNIEQRLIHYDVKHKTIAEYDYVVTNNGTLDEAVQKVHDILEREGICLKNT